MKFFIYQKFLGLQLLYSILMFDVQESKGFLPQNLRFELIIVIKVQGELFNGRQHDNTHSL